MINTLNLQALINNTRCLIVIAYVCKLIQVRLEHVALFYGKTQCINIQFGLGESETGSENDSQIDSVARIAPVVALYAGKEEMLQKVEDMVRVTQNNDVPVAFALVAARVFRAYFMNLILQKISIPSRSINICQLGPTKRGFPADMSISLHPNLT